MGLSFLKGIFWVGLRPGPNLPRPWAGPGNTSRVSDIKLMKNHMVSQQELEKWAVTAWAIWAARNKFYFQHYRTHPKVIADMACGLLEEYQRFMDTLGQD